MSWSATIGAQTFTEANLDGNAYAEEATGFPAIVQAIAEETAALKGVAALSETALTPAAGATIFTLLAAPPAAWKVGQILRASSAGDTSHYMVGTVAAIDGSALTLTVSFAAGATERADWVLTYPLFTGYLQLDGGTLDGPFRIQGHSQQFDSPAGQFVYLRFSRGDVKHLDFGLDDTPLSDSAGGSRVYMHTFDNSGEFTGRPLEIDRATGEIRTMSVDLKGYALANANLRGSRMSVDNLGSVGAETVTVNHTRWDVLRATLSDDVTFDFVTLDPDFAYRRTLLITQGTGGGFVPTWTMNAQGTGIQRFGSLPDYANQTAGTVTRVVAEVWDSELRLWETEEP